MKQQTSLLLISILLLSIPAQAARVGIPIAGNINLTFNLGGEIPANFNGDVTSDATFELTRNENVVGTLRLQLKVKEATTGDFNLTGETTGTANIGLDAVNNKILVNSLNWYHSTSISGWRRSGQGIARTYSFAFVRDGTQFGNIVADIYLNDIEYTGATYIDILSSGNKIGTVNLDSSLKPLLEDLQSVTNSFAGFISTSGGKAVTSGAVKIAAGGAAVSAQIIQVGPKGAYGLNKTPLVISGIQGTQVFFYVNEFLVKNDSLTSETGVRRVDLIVPSSESNVNFPDEDRDGVPDARDECPHSESDSVDDKGCTCAQWTVKAPHLACTFKRDTGPQLAQPPPPKPVCETANTCLGAQDYCTENKSIVMNCPKCGCPEGFTCATEDQVCPEEEECINDGGCYKLVERTGAKCLKNKYQIVPRGTNCTILGQNYIDFLAEDPLKRSMTDFIWVSVHGGAFGGKKEIRKQAINKIASLTLCIDTQDLGCVSSNVNCPGEEYLIPNKGEVGGILQQEVESVFTGHTETAGVETATEAGAAAGAGIGVYFFGVGALFGAAIGAIVGAIGGAFFGDVDVSFGFNAAQLDDVTTRLSYPCPSTLVTMNSSCKTSVSNGAPEDKIDLLFLGSGFANETEFNKTATILLDYRGNRTGTTGEGLFSREPFKKNKERFNILIASTKDGIKHHVDEFKPSAGALPNLTDVAAFVSACPEQDYTFIISKTGFRSHCALEPSQPCYLSLDNETLPGRQLLRLAGKRIGNLADEYYFEITQNPVGERVGGFDYLGIKKPNCQFTLQDARNAWGKLRTTGKVLGFFEGCGGECDSRCEKYIRPTLNSALRYHDKRCLGTKDTDCKKGPPYDPFYIVNEQAIIKALQEFGKEEEEPEGEAKPEKTEKGGESV